eukprot:TRINITY_DN2734_c0_g1_i1.p1 TRINITY_DN2734_c0_g1~~TRINITY_DN2734_c0_g1_i1.p1  ORF type:complete len:210 (-),score=48.91 TRINITY_DN2734_c0_g1_i1:201-830(-)
MGVYRKKKSYSEGEQEDEFGPFSNFPHLTMLELGANQIREIEGLDNLTSLTQLYLGKNKITSIKGLNSLANLRILSLQNNRIVDISGLDSLVHLEELYLSHNGIVQVQGLDNLTSLKILDLSNNRIEHVSGQNFEKLNKLGDLWINHNKLACWTELETLKFLKLETIYLEANPLAADSQYITKLLLIFPHLTQIDATYLSTKAPFIPSS